MLLFVTTPMANICGRNSPRYHAHTMECRSPRSSGQAFRCCSSVSLGGRRNADTVWISMYPMVMPIAISQQAARRGDSGAVRAVLARPILLARPVLARPVLARPVPLASARGASAAPGAGPKSGRPVLRAARRERAGPALRM